jgi:hypothetical protein
VGKPSTDLAIDDFKLHTNVISLATSYKHGIANQSEHTTLIMTAIDGTPQTKLL